MANTNNYQKMVDFLELLKEVKESKNGQTLEQILEMRKQFKEFVFKRENHTNKDRIFAIDGVPLVILLDDLSSVKLMSPTEALDCLGVAYDSVQILNQAVKPEISIKKKGAFKMSLPHEPSGLTKIYQLKEIAEKLKSPASDILDDEEQKLINQFWALTDGGAIYRYREAAWIHSSLIVAFPDCERVLTVVDSFSTCGGVYVETPTEALKRLGITYDSVKILNGVIGD